MVGEDGTKKDVNRFLYELQKKDVLKRKAIGNKNNWHWSLAEAERGGEIGKPNGGEAAEPQENAPELPREEVDSLPDGREDDMIDRICDTKLDPKRFLELGESLKPDVDGNRAFEAKRQHVLGEICRIANEELAKGDEVCSLELIGSAAYGTNIKGSDYDYALKCDRPIGEGSWGFLGERLTEELEHPVTIKSKSITVAVPEILEIVAEEGPMEYNKVPFGNLVEGKTGNFSRKVVHDDLKRFFQDYPGAANAVRVAKALLIPALKDIGKQPWSPLITELLYREVRRKERSGSINRTKDYGGVDAFKQFGKDILAYPGYVQPCESSVVLAVRWAMNDAKHVGEEVHEGLRKSNATLDKLNKRLRLGLTLTRARGKRRLSMQIGPAMVHGAINIRPRGPRLKCFLMSSEYMLQAIV